MSSSGSFEDSWEGQVLEPPQFLETRLAMGIGIGIISILAFIHILFKMEAQNTTYKMAIMEASLGDRDTQLELEVETSDSNEDNKRSTGDYVQADGPPLPRNQNQQHQENGTGDGIYKLGDTRHKVLSTTQKVLIVAHVMVLTLLNYLLLVFLPGSIWLSFIAVVAIWILTLQSYLREELSRRQRYDRLLTMIGLFFILAGCLTYITYCQLALAEGSIYQGPARIVGYDDSIYENKDGETLRADVQVAWGGSWGCNTENDRQCTARVHGALCQAEYDYNEDDDDRRRARRRRARERGRTRRFLAAEKDFDDLTEEQQEEVVEEVVEYDAELEEEYEEIVEEDEEYIEEEAEEEVTEYEEELDEEYEEIEEQDKEQAEEDAEEEVEDEVEEYEEEVEEVYEEDIEIEEEDEEDLEYENEQLEEDLEEEEEKVEELEDEVAELSGGTITYDDDNDASYVYEDDVFEDDYWEYDWDSVWGEYACEDLFDADLSGQTKKFNPNTPPGHDQWPTINIYGSCNSCQAYIMDYYSTEHFLEIRLYQVQSRLYLTLGFFIMIVAAVFALKEKLRPTKEKEIVLLTHEGGVPA